MWTFFVLDNITFEIHSATMQHASGVIMIPSGYAGFKQKRVMQEDLHFFWKIEMETRPRGNNFYYIH